MCLHSRKLHLFLTHHESSVYSRCLRDSSALTVDRPLLYWILLQSNPTTTIVEKKREKKKGKRKDWRLAKEKEKKTAQTLPPLLSTMIWPPFFTLSFASSLFGSREQAHRKICPLFCRSSCCCRLARSSRPRPRPRPLRDAASAAVSPAISATQSEERDALRFGAGTEQSSCCQRPTTFTLYCTCHFCKNCLGLSPAQLGPMVRTSTSVCLCSNCHATAQTLMKVRVQLPN